MIHVQPSSTGRLQATHLRAATPGPVPKDLVQDDINGHYRMARRGRLLHAHKLGPSLQHQVLAWLRDRVDHRIPRAWYQLVLGHDLHISTYARLYVKHYHATERDPFTGRLGWLEDVGLVSQGKVTTAFRDFEIDNLITDTTAYGDYKYHEVGLSAAAEANTQTALTTTTAITRVAGTQTEVSADVYQSVATITADTAETWQEHGIFNATSAGVMLDRSLISPVVAVVASDTVTFTYQLTKSAEA